MLSSARLPQAHKLFVPVLLVAISMLGVIAIALSGWDWIRNAQSAPVKLLAKSDVAIMAMGTFFCVLGVIWAQTKEWKRFSGIAALTAPPSWLSLGLGVLLALSIAQMIVPWAQGWATSITAPVLVALSWALVTTAVVPPHELPKAVREQIVPLSVSGSSVILIYGLGIAAQDSWSVLADATFSLTRLIVSLYATEVIVDADRYILGADSFRVLIAAACSGYEGIGMMGGFLTIFLVTSRKTLRFPHAALLIPIGLIAVWVFNSVRIAMLIAIGAYYSPEVAIDGFHSRAGWISFLLVSVGVVFAAYRTPFFWKRTLQQESAASEGAEKAEAVPKASTYLPPFLALLTADLFISALMTTPQAGYPLKVLAISGALFALRDKLNFRQWRPTKASCALGLFVALLWIITDPGLGTETELETWFATLGPGAAIAWLLLRGVGTTLLVPIAEELAFRKYLFGAMQAIRLGSLPPAALAALPIIATSLAFGAIHTRWLAGGLAGLAFCLIYLRNRKIGEAIWAHGVANGAIFLYAVLYDEWALL